MKKSILFLASAAAILAGCAREATIETPETGRKHITIQATVNPETRTTVDIADGVGTYAWTDNEQIAVFESTADAATPFTVNDPEKGYFDGTIEAGNTLIGAVSPKSAVTKMVSVDGEVEYKLSLSGVYNQSETNAVMVAGAPKAIESDPDSEPLYKFQFKHAAGLMKVTYVNLPVGTAGVKFSTNKPITGTVDLETLTGVEITNNDVNGESEAVVLFDTPVTEVNTTGEFYIPVPTGSYTGFTICLVDDDFNPIPGTTKSKSTAFTVERADIIRIPTVTLQASEIISGYFKVTDASEITAGDYLIVYEGDATNSARVLSGVDAEKNLGTCADVVIENNVIDGTSYAAYNIEASILANGHFTLKLGSVYLAYTSSQTSKYNNLWGVDDAAVDGTEWILSVDEVRSAYNTGRTIQYNYNSGNDRFAGYASSQSPITLFKKGSSSSVSKLPAEISFAEGSPFMVAQADAESFTAPQLNNPNGLTISWSIEDEDEIAVFDENDGSLLLTGDPGTITVTATSAETSVFASGSASYTVTVIPAALSSIEALKTAIDENNGAEDVYNLILNNAVVSWAKDGKAYLEDNTAGIYVYAGAANLQAGRKLNGETVVKAKTFNGQREISGVTGTALSELMSTETVDVPVFPMSIADVNDDEEDQAFENMRVVIENATIVVSNNKKYLSDGTNQVQLYALSGSGASLDGFNADDVVLSATGYPMYFSNSNTHFPELIIVDTDDIVVKLTPSITPNPTSLEFTKAGGNQTITMSAENFTSTPTYTVVDNTNPDVFSTSISGNVITVTASANTGEAQTGVLTIKGVSGDDEATVTVNLSQASGVSDSYTYVFNSKSWGATIDGEDEDWVSGKDGGQFNNTNNGIQVTTTYSGANGTSPYSFTEIEEIVVTYCTNASNGAGAIMVTVGNGTAKSFTVNSTGGTTHRTCSFSYSPKESGKVKIEVTCTTNSIYICDVTIKAKDKVIPVKYAISLAEVANGTIAADKETAIEGETVTLSATPNSGYEFDSWTVINASTNATITVTDNKFVMPAANVSVSATFTKSQGGDPATSTLIFTQACGGSGTADDGVIWTVSSDGSESSFDSTKGIHYGTNSAQVQYIKLSTSGITGTIKSVVVNASAASGVSATVDVTVGGVAFGGTPQNLTSSAANYTFTGSASGEIVVTVTKPNKAAKALYVKSVVVTYE